MCKRCNIFLWLLLTCGALRAMDLEDAEHLPESPRARLSAKEFCERVKQLDAFVKRSGAYLAVLSREVCTAPREYENREQKIRGARSAVDDRLRYATGLHTLVMREYSNMESLPAFLRLKSIIKNLYHLSGGALADVNTLHPPPV